MTTKVNISSATDILEHRANMSAASPLSSKKKAAKKPTGQLPHHKAGRVKVGIRCRPPFQEEIERAKGGFAPIIETRQDSRDPNALGKVALSLSTGKQREFMFDYVFGPSSSQDYVYDRVARPVVNDVLNGFNGTIFAYGQTGTGKTYTMGILETVTDDTAGLIPRAISGVFQYANDQHDIDITVTMSFLQIYRENIQDLLSSSVVAGGGGVLEDNLPIREDPMRGFYVEGLQEYVVHSYEEAEALLNLGLESRAIASTLMNSTSSRSHTVLTINIEQRGDIPPMSDRDTDTNGSLLRRRPTGGRILHSKLLMVDLAGSERVRKTISKGTRLDEAKSINTSLSALGNVIAALAESNSAHVPYRDSKLTRILNDSLGGTASTSLIATVGPAASNYNETLSTLQFASRCMAVKSTPVQHEELDFADMCTRLQQQLSSLEGDMVTRLSEQETKYEHVIRDLREQLKMAKSTAPVAAVAPPSGSSVALEAMLDFLETGDTEATHEGSWLNSEPYEDEPSVAEQATVLLAFCFDSMKNLHGITVEALREASNRTKNQKKVLAERYKQENARELAKKRESEAMEQQDPMRHATDFNVIGSHLAPMSRVDALYRVEENFTLDGDDDLMKRAVLLPPSVKNTISEYTSSTDLAIDLDYMSNGIVTNISLLNESLEKKDMVFRGLKDELLDQLVEKRSREEEVVNWSYILKYLLATTTKLRSQLKRENKIRSEEDRSPIAPTPTQPNAAQVSPYIDTSSAVNSLGSLGAHRAMGISTPKPADKPPLPSSVETSHTTRYRMRSAVSTQRDDRRRQNEAGKLGPRLAQSYHAVRHNTLAAADIDQIGPPPDEDDYSQVESETDGSFRSAATVGSIPPHASRSQHSSFAHEVVSGLGVQGHQAIAAMSVIDRVSNMTEEQIRGMDPDTQAQVRQIRREIGLDRETTRTASANDTVRITPAQTQSRHAPPPSSSAYGSQPGSNYSSRYQVAASTHRQQQTESLLPTSRRFPAVVSADLSGFSSSASPVYRVPVPSDEYDDDDDDFSQLDSELEWN